MSLDQLAAYPSLNHIVKTVLELWPEHARFIESSILPRDDHFLAHSERLSSKMLLLAEAVDTDLEALCRDYRFLCEEIVLPEELHFRRTGRYRLQSFEDAFSSVYDNAEFMTRYMNGLMVSDVLWVNHCRALLNYVDGFLAALPAGARLLEIGPGHGLLLNLAAESRNVAELAAWDISKASLDMSRHCLETLAPGQEVVFQERNIFDPSLMGADNANQFDGIVFSEVLEHLERPAEALKVLLHLCKPGGLVWINVPANSPAPDHLFLVREPDHARQLVEQQGFEIASADYYPMTGVALEKAIRHKLTVSCVITGRKPEHRSN